MRHFKFSAFEINRIDEDNEEHLRQFEFDSAYAAVSACLDPSRRLDYLTVELRQNDSEYAQISPYATWGTKEAFEALLDTHRLATKIQLNTEMSHDQATEELIIRALDNKRLAS